MPLDAADFEIETQRDRDLRMLRRAREGISRPGGWCQNGLRSGGGHCAVGWIPGPYKEWEDTVLRLLVPALPFWHRIGANHIPIGAVAGYNDLPWRRQKTMVRLFDRAIRRLERA